MNRAQRQLVWSSAIVAALLGITVAREFAKPTNCRDELIRWADGTSRVKFIKSRICG